MLGSFRKRGCTCKKKRCTCGAKWHYRYDIIDPKTGKRKQKETPGFSTKGEAEEEAKKILASLQQGTFVEEKDITFEAFAEQWIKLYSSSGKVKISTIDIRRSKLNMILKTFENIKLKDITLLAYQNMLNELSEKGFARKTICSVHETGSLLFKKAVSLGIIATDITKSAEIPITKKSVEEMDLEPEIPKYLEKEELSIFLKTARESANVVDYPLYLTMAYTGLRVGELSALKWSDVNFNDYTINVTKTIYRRLDAVRIYLLQTPKTKSSRRKIDIDETVISALKAHKEYQDSCRIPNDPNYHDKDFIFTSNVYPGYPVTSNGIRRRMQILLRRAKLNSELTPHSLRHTHTSLLAEAGVSLETIMNRLGHHDDKITRKVYLHITKPRKIEASQKFAELMRGI